MVLLSPLTLGIHSLVWMHKLCRRIGAELQRRGISYRFGAKDFWLFNMLFGFLASICSGVTTALFTKGDPNVIVVCVLSTLSLLSLIGPLVFIHKLMKSTNLMNEDYNNKG